MTATKPARPPSFSYPALPEQKLCYAVTFSVMMYAWWCVYEAGKGFEWQIGDSARVDVLPVVGQRFKDQSNWEWERWSPFAFSYLPVYLAHFIFFNLGSMYMSEKVFVPLYTLSSIAACCYYYTPILTFYSLIQGTLIFATSIFTKKQIIVWLSSLPILYYTMHESQALGEDIFLVLLFVSYTMLSYISYAVETQNAVVRKEDDTLAKKYLRMMYFAFYQPYMVSLIVLYPDFERQMAERKTRQRDWVKCFKFLVELAFWWAVAELCLYFLYFEAILNRIDYANSLPKDQFVALGQALGCFFNIKYVVIFGLPSLFAHLDNMQPLKPPICILFVTLYSNVWRSFDRGLYQFFKRYIFVPICQPTFSLPRKIVGVLVSYGFVLIWHGFYHHNIVWIVLNIVALFMEMSVKAVYTIDPVRAWLHATMSDVTIRRILGWLHIIPFAFGLYSNFYFLGGSAVGGAFVQRILIEETIPVRWPFLLLIFFGWFHTQTCMEFVRLEELEQRREEKREKEERKNK